MVAFNLFDDFQLEGNFWLPGSPTSHFPGVISVKHNDEISLILRGAFRNLSAVIAQPRVEYPLLIGFCGGEKCTLYQGLEVGIKFQMPGTPISTIEFQFLFIGAHFNSEAEMRFSEVSANYTNLEEWLGHFPFSRADDQKGGILISYTVPPNYETEVPSLQSKVQFEHECGSKVDVLHRVILNYISSLKIVPQTPQNFEWFWEALWNLRNLLALFMSEAIYLKRLHGHLEVFENSSPQKSRQRIVQVYFSDSSKHFREGLDTDNMLVRFADIRSTFPAVLEAWFSESKRLDAVYELLFGVFYQSRMHLEFRFLSLMQALESFHRSISSGKYLSGEDYQRIADVLKGAIPKEIPCSLKSSLKSRIDFGNEFSLKKRMTLLCDEVPQLLKTVFSPDIKTFVKQAVGTRNYLTHYTKQPDETVWERDKLWFPCERLRFLLTIHLLKRLTISENLIIEGVRRHGNFNRLLSS